MSHHCRPRSRRPSASSLLGPLVLAGALAGCAADSIGKPAPEPDPEPETPVARMDAAATRPDASGRETSAPARQDAAAIPNPARQDAAAIPNPVGAPAIARGINLGNTLDAPKEGAWGAKLDAEHFRMVKQAGFDHVRLPVRFNAHAALTAPFTLDPAILARVDWAIDQALSQGLSIVVDLHHYEELHQDPVAHRARFIEIWKQLAARFKHRPPHVILEILNEPQKNLTAELWNPLLTETIAAIRAIDAERDIIVDATNYAGSRELRDALVLPADDPHLIGSFHLYAPILFTHQAAASMGPEYGTKGVIFPGPPMQPLVPVPAALATEWVKDWFERYNAQPTAMNPGGARAITDAINHARTFAMRTGKRVYVGEFGVNDAADEASRIRWLKLAREELEKRGFGWAVWNMFGSFALYDDKAKRWNEPLKAALIP